MVREIRGQIGKSQHHFIRPSSTTEAESAVTILSCVEQTGTLLAIVIRHLTAANFHTNGMVLYVDVVYDMNQTTLHLSLNSLTCTSVSVVMV